MNKGLLVLLTLGISGAVCGQQKIAIAETESMDFPAGGVLHLRHSLGDVFIEGWDQTGTEITITESSVVAYDGGHKHRLDDASVTAQRSGDELVITTALGGRGSLGSRAGFDYRIRIPRDARVRVEHDAGEVHVADIAGDLQVTNRRGEITLRLPPEEAYAVDASSKFGNVVSDIPGREQRRFWLVGHRFVPSVAEAAHKLDLRTGYGDIVIQRIRRPAPPAPVGQP